MYYKSSKIVMGVRTNMVVSIHIAVDSKSVFHWILKS